MNNSSGLPRDFRKSIKSPIELTGEEVINLAANEALEFTPGSKKVYKVGHNVMMNGKNKLAFGGGCHWCTEAVFQSLRGVDHVEQGWITSNPPNDTLSEGVIVHYNADITLDTLVAVHLLTHSSTSLHSMRKKYRSAIYYFDIVDKPVIEETIKNMALENNAPYVTQVLPFVTFKENMESQLNYYKKNKGGLFCERYIDPKLTIIRERFGGRFRNDL